MMNIEHPTTNIERRMMAGLRSRSMFGVQCSAFDVSHF